MTRHDPLSYMDQAPAPVPSFRPPDLRVVPVQFGRTVEKPVAIEPGPVQASVNLNLQRVLERARRFNAAYRHESNA